ncbi:MAG: anti-virulence regulator CigR family protein [Castellaniella sp.]|uniref:anti-virulence regulator CigR family protein n=1 Tax=Castellaniella sp. TaxID=1955812 RepID=UPI003A8522FB
MDRREILKATMMVGSLWAFGVGAAPPEGKGNGKGKGGGPHDKSGSSAGKRGGAGPAHDSKEKPGKGHSGKNRLETTDPRTDYDAYGRRSDYFDDRRDDRGRVRDNDAYPNLVYAGITSALAHQYARDAGFGRYASLPPGIRKNLARGKPLPPGIAKKVVPGALLGRLPRHEGYEWRMAGSDLILIFIATAVVADVLYDVFD